MKYVFVIIAWTGSAVAGAPVLSATSYGKIFFGDRLETVEGRLGEKVPAIQDPDENHCRQIEFKAYPGLTFMVEDGVVSRVETSSRVPTSTGFTVGASMDAIRKTNPSVVIEPHQYDPDGHYLTFMTTDGKAAVLMEEAQGKITDIRGGLVPSVQYVEGCL